MESPWTSLTSDILGITGSSTSMAPPPAPSLLASALISGKKRTAKKSSRQSLLKPNSDNACSLGLLAKQSGIGGSQDSDESSDESDVLDAAEEEASLEPISRKHVESFDKIKRRRRFIQRQLFQEDIFSSDDNEAFEVTEPDFIAMFRSHVKRRKLRRKIRTNPDFEEEPNRKELRKVLLKIPTPRGDCRTKEASRKNRSSSTDQMNQVRRKAWIALAKKEVSRAHKSRHSLQKERITACKKLANQCMRAVRSRAASSQKSLKEANSRAKKLTREMQSYWRHFDKIERQQRRQQEKELEEQQKIDVQLMEAKRQQRKLNFLITQTELYAHFMANKIEQKDSKSEEDILKNLDENQASGRLAEIETYDCEAVKREAYNNAAQAVEMHFDKTRSFDQQVEVDIESDHPKLTKSSQERLQPDIFDGTLKKYQLKGMNWLLDLYDQGINGILADEMGLGKTVQALAMLAHIAEKYNIWGPFLVITPASTLHNWQQEIAKFIPSFKVVPYWGSPQERKVLRHFWDQTNLHKKSASFHVVVTSYQLIVTDFKYFNRIKWQYMVLDEAQAIKSSASQRWKMLLEFKCRNRLLLSGTPIQNSMAELWSLLHFVMPTMFDSHDEFNDWFSKDIESSAESKSQVDEKQISRLHLILKPFMLRRIKKDVENELTDKVEVLVYCPLTIRQKLLYMGLKRKIRIEDLLQNLGSSRSSSAENSNLASSLMNLVMQFRKVCNHPELFERREVKSPLVMNLGPYVVPKLVFNEKIHSESTANSTRHLLYNKLSIFNPYYVNQSLKSKDSTFSYLPFIELSPGEQADIHYSLLSKVLSLSKLALKQRNSVHKINWKYEEDKVSLHLVPIKTVYNNSSVLKDLQFCQQSNSAFGFNNINLVSMPETVEHRQMRAEKLQQPLIQEFPHIAKPVQILEYQLCHLPSFLYSNCPLKVAVPGRLMYAHSPKTVIDNLRHTMCTTSEGKSAIVQGLVSSKKPDFEVQQRGGLCAARPTQGWSNIVVPNKQSLVSDAGKLFVLDRLLSRLKEGGHRVLIYSQMTKMIDLLEEFMVFRKYTFMRLDGSSKIHERRDMVADFQQRSDIFVFLLSTRAGGLGINLTAADTVIFYDSDWNPTVDQQAMDRAHRLGQTKQVTVYRLICKGTIEERILQRAREKSEIQRMVIQGGSFKGQFGAKPGELKPKEVVSLLLDDDEMQSKLPSGTITPISAAKRKLEDDMSSASESTSRPESPPPMFDFLGDKMGPKRSSKKKRTKVK